jgi:predicted nucleic-acid-binding Zn-ribbon protein
MKQTQQCPKCAGRKLWVIERFRVPTEGAPGHELPVATQLEKGGLFTIGRALPVGRFDLWLCDACGYSELWATGITALREDPERGVRLVDHTLVPEGPFR